MDRQSRNDYEARATAVQQHIRQLVDELARLRDMRSRTRPSATDSLHRLLQLQAEIRPVTQLLRTNIHTYLQASRDWDNAVSEFRLHEDRSSWAQSMLQQRHLFFHGLSISTMTLDFQFAQLLHDYTSTLDDIEAFIRSDSAPADAHSAATPFTAPAAAHSAANGTVSGSNTLAATHSVVNGDRQPVPARRRSSSGIRPVPTTQFYRNDGHKAQNPATAQGAPRSTSHRSAAVPTPAQQSSSRSPSSNQALTFVNSSRQRRTAGIMAHADGDISQAIPLAWQPTNTGGPVYSTAPSPGRNARSAARPGQDGGSGSARPNHDSVPSRTVNQDRTRQLQQAMVNCAISGSGQTTAPTRPLTVSAYGTPMHASHAASAPSSAPADHGVDFGRENSSTFYRNATYPARAASTGIASPPLVLRELSLTPFEGDIRRYSTFRNRFLEIVEAQRNLEPRHKFQYLLQYLRGEPLRLVDGFPITDGGYFLAIDQLEERYGNTHRIRKLLTSDLLNLQPAGSSTASLRQFYDQAFRVNTELQQLDSGTDSSEFLSDILMGKLPADLRLHVIRQPDYQRKKTISSILKALRLHLRTLEEAADAGFTWSSQPQGRTTTLWSGPPGRFGQSNNRGNQYRSGQNDTDFSYVADTIEATCEFCDSRQHRANDCNVFTTVPQRLRRLMKLKRCFLCLQEGHQSRSCPQRSRPPLEPDGHEGHHRSLCRSALHPAPMDDTKTKQPCSETTETDDGPGKDAHATPALTGPPESNSRRDGAQDGPNGLPGIPAVLRSSGSTCRQAGRWSKGHQTAHAPRFEEPYARLKPNSATDTPQPKELRTALGRGCTTQPPAATTATSMMERDTDASGDDDSLLGRRQLPCSTDICSSGQTTQRTWGYSTEVLLAGHATAIRESQGLSLRGFEEVSSQRPWKPTTITRFDSDDGSSAVPTPAIATAVLVECVKTQASATASPLAARSDVVAFFDSGCNGTFITKALMHRLQLPSNGQRSLRTNTFGRPSACDLTAIDTTLVLWTTDRRPLLLDVTAVDTIASAVNTTLVDELDLVYIRQNDQPIRPLRLAPDILIGQNLVRLFQRQQVPALPHGYDVHLTNIGYVVGGAGRTTLDPPEMPLQLTPSSPSRLLHSPTTLDAVLMRRYYRMPDLMEPATLRHSTRASTRSVDNRTEQPVPQALGPTDSDSSETHEKDCFYCSFEAAPAATPSTVNGEAKHALPRLPKPSQHLPQEETTPLDTTQPPLLAQHPTQASSPNPSIPPGDATRTDRHTRPNHLGPDAKPFAKHYGHFDLGRPTPFTGHSMLERSPDSPASSLKF